MPKVITVHINGQEIETKSGVSIHHLLNLHPHLKPEEEPLAAIVNNRCVGLYHRVYSNCSVETLDISHSQGMLIYRRTACAIMYAAFAELYPFWDLEIGQSLEGGYFFEIKAHHKDAPALPGDKDSMRDLSEKVMEKMQEIVDAKLRLRPVLVATDEAREYMRNAKRMDKVRLLDLHTRPEIEWLVLRQFRDLTHGPVASSTGAITRWDIVPYMPGILLRFPTREGRRPGKVRKAAKLFQVYRETRSWNELVGTWNVGLLNAQGLFGNISEVIKVGEGLHEKKIANIADSISNRVQQSGHSIVVLVAGPSSSGKTTFSKRLAIQLRVNGLQPKVISLDNYYINRVDNPVHEDGSLDLEHIDALDLPLLNDHLERLLRGEEVQTPIYNFQRGERSSKTIPMQLAPGQVLLTEGIHGLNDQLTAGIPAEQKFKIYVSALTQLSIDDHNRINTSDTRLLRRIVRDRKYRGYNAAQTIEQWPSVQRGEGRWIFPFQEDADVMFNSALIYEHAALAPYAHRYLLEVSQDSPAYVEAYRLLQFVELFIPIFVEEVPPTSILREFIGGSSFNY